ncbi:transposase family protein [Aquibium pacificus]|uniref:transposase family protein n=1 Tax=Aquibium pacificus TaxID=3153579 RepID=UPI0035A17499
MVVAAARSGISARACPLCRRKSDRVHSRYVRRVADLPCSGRKVELRLCALARSWPCAGANRQFERAP